MDKRLAGQALGSLDPGHVEERNQQVRSRRRPSSTGGTSQATGRKWVTVYEAVLAKIESGALLPGEQVPPELALAEEHKVARGTARQALEQLTLDGLITAGAGRAGRTVRVYDPMEWPLHEFEMGARLDDPTRQLDDWAARVLAMGRTPHEVVRGAGRVPATPQVGIWLALPTGTEVVYRDRLRSVDGIPTQWAVSYFPIEVAGGTELETVLHSITAAGGVLKAIGWEQVWVRDRIRSRRPTLNERELLQMVPGDPVLQHARIAFTETGRPFRVMVTVGPGERNELITERRVKQ